MLHRTDTEYFQRIKARHRLVYQAVHDVRLGRWQLVCHSCDVKNCINPDHLWLGTQKDNLQDCSRKGGFWMQSVTHCPRGHEYTAENTYVERGGARNCKTCARARGRIKAGWPPELAYTMGAQRKGSRPVNARWADARKT